MLGVYIAGTIRESRKGTRDESQQKALAMSPSRMAKTTLTLALIVTCAPRTTARCYPAKVSRAAPADKTLSLITLCAACRKAMSMSDGDLSDQIARIESDIEQLAKTLDGCRKAMLFSKVVITAGRNLDIGLFPRGDQV